MPATPLHIIQAHQAFGEKIASEKRPTWYACKDIRYPQRLSLEQCSSEWTARYKASLVSGDSLVDLTGGLGIDCSFMSQQFAQTTYVEQQETLCELARHNFACLNLPITVVNDTCEQYLPSLPAVDVIFLDPARRNEQGGKVVLLQDCTPNLVEIGDSLLQKCQTLLVKLSPMIDVESVLRHFPTTQEVHIVAVNNECKEVLLRIDAEKVCDNPKMVCVNLLPKTAQQQLFSFLRQDEAVGVASYANPMQYLYEPNAAILKAGGFKQIAEQLGIYKLHPSSHLYTSDRCITDFPGRIFAIDRITKVQRKEINDIEKANLSIRNFPGSVADVRKKLKLKDGGDTYIFATTLHDNSKVLIVGKRIRNDK